MLQLNVENKVSPALRAYSVHLERVVIETLDDLRAIIANRAVTQYMREFRTDEVTTPASRRLNAPLIRRFKFTNDTGTLRRLTGRLTHSLIGNEGGLTPAFEASSGNETLLQFSVEDGQVTMTFGSKTPYAAIHEYGGVTRNGGFIRARPYLNPAVRDIDGSGIVGRLFDQRLHELASSLNLSE